MSLTIIEKGGKPLLQKNEKSFLNACTHRNEKGRFLELKQSYRPKKRTGTALKNFPLSTPKRNEI